MKAQLRGTAVALLVWTTAGRTAAAAASPSPSPLPDDVPGCGCSASTTCGSFFSSYSEVAACSLVKRSDPPYVFEDVVNSTTPVCDALESDADFRELHGFGGEGTGAEPGFLPMEVVTGTCADARARQDSCPAIFRDDDRGATAANETATTSGDESVLDGSLLGGSLVGRFMGIPDRCHSYSFEQPVGGLGDRSFRRSIQVIATCRSEFDEAVSKGYADDELLIYMEMDINYGEEEEQQQSGLWLGIGLGLGEEEEQQQWQPQPPTSPCGSSRIGELADKRPTLTSDDWIEPRGGRRYMCHDFVRSGRPYSMLVVSLGIEPCGGTATRAPTEAPTAPIPFVEASSVGSFVPTTRHGAVGFALAVVISLCILC